MKSDDNILENKKDRVIRIIVGCLLLQIWLTPLLWWSFGRSFPVIPLFPPVSFLPVINGYWTGYVLPWGFVFSLLALLVFPKEKKIGYLVVALAGLLLFLDVNRLQIWMYQWCCMLAVIAFSTKDLHWKSILQFMLLALYIWSGLNKLSIPYINHSFPWLMEAFSWTEPLGQFSVLAVTTALLEIGIGLGFCFPKTRKAACYTAVVMHLIILLILGPLGYGFNQVVWPWNLAMIFLVFLLFYNESFDGVFSIWKKNFLAKIIIVLWGLMPLGNVFEIWDEQLSFKMYTGTNPEGMLLDESRDKICFPDSLKVYYTRDGIGGSERILIDDWALMELKVPPYVSQRSLKHIAREWCSCLEKPEYGALEVLRVWRWSEEERENLHFGCQGLLEK